MKPENVILNLNLLKKKIDFSLLVPSSLNFKKRANQRCIDNWKFHLKNHSEKWTKKTAPIYFTDYVGTRDNFPKKKNLWKLISTCRRAIFWLITVIMNQRAKSNSKQWLLFLHINCDKICGDSMQSRNHGERL